MNRKVPVPYTLGTPYTVEDDRERADDLWASINIDAGVVALSDSFVSAKGLPEAMRFPWDHTRGIYFVNAYHNLHCLVSNSKILPEASRWALLSDWVTEKDLPSLKRIRSRNKAKRRFPTRHPLSRCIAARCPLQRG